jgi:hypothetical protein
MARSHVRLQFGMWRKPGHADVTKDARWFYVTILGDETLNQAGVVRVALEMWADDAGMTLDEARAALAELVDRRFAVVDQHELLVRTFVRNDGVSDQPNVLRNALDVARHIRSPLLRRELAAELRKLPPPLPDKVNEKTGRVFRYPDPHACADELDPDGTPPPGENPSRNPSVNGSHAPVDNSPRNPSGNPSAGTLPGTLGRTPRGRGRGRGSSSGPVGGALGGRAPAREEPPPIHNPPCEKPCHVCRDARLADERAAADTEQREQTDRAAAQAATRQCRWCDADGWRIDPDNPQRGPLTPATRCNHLRLVDTPGATA